MISWAEWKAWTEEDCAQALDYQLADCLNSARVREFMQALTDWLTYCRVLETSRHLEDPARKTRTYSEALREVQQKLVDITNLHEGKNYGGVASRGIGRGR
jgi:hypothetical protein